MIFTPIRKKGLGSYEDDLKQYLGNNPIAIDQDLLNSNVASSYALWAEKNVDENNNLIQTDTGIKQTPKTTDNYFEDRTDPNFAPTYTNTAAAAPTAVPTTATAKTTEASKWVPGLENWQTGVIGGLGLAAIVTVVVVVSKPKKKKSKKRR